MVKIFSKIYINTLFCLGLGFTATAVLAAAEPASPLTGNIPVTLTIEPGCSVTPVGNQNQVSGSSDNWATLNFGSHTWDGSTLTAKGGFDIECTKGAAPTLAFSDGKNPDTTNHTREMTSNNSKLVYSLLKSDGTPVPSMTNPEKNVQNGVYNIVAKTTPPPGIATGDYTDSVEVKLTW